ncbi:MAG: CPBP family intramembrane metalloprotease [Atribacterota bacterium]|nr:CPBP family intramembrane metalloprotease [Atribacterota bacterium]
MYFIFGGQWVMPGSLIISTAYMFIPLTVTILLQKVIYKEDIKKSLDVSFRINRWFIIAWILPILLTFLTLGINIMLPDVEFSPDLGGFFARLESSLSPEQLALIKQQAENFPAHPFWIGIFQALLAGVTINAVAGFGEELGWRGFLQKELNYLGFWKSSMLIGFVWGIWHAPLILQGHNYPENPQFGVLMMIMFTLLLSPIFSYVRLKAKSVLAAAIIHGSLNASIGLPLMILKGGNDLTTGITGLSGFAALLMINLVLFIYDYYFSNEKIMSKNIH